MGSRHSAVFFRTRLTNKNEYITVQEELENLENYFAILRIRYAGSFEYSFHVEDEELLSCLVPKLILQPLARKFCNAWFFR